MTPPLQTCSWWRWCLPLFILIQSTNPRFSPPHSSRLPTRPNQPSPPAPAHSRDPSRITCGLHWLPRRCVVSSLWAKFLRVWPTSNSSGVPCSRRRLRHFDATTRTTRKRVP
ncbi:hypothetical protein DFH08DRAFT_875428 [Mycena albidolilacea]|uniref:Secreted protein n=1 Tax=Mycena albidolilacea TaxID=1033008 RepID=A0AAD6ZU16_9AGAR|nr:hypothetical protein DFH08DRAFT_875428 [Mycena albidolilacea]